MRRSTIPPWTVPLLIGAAAVAVLTLGPRPAGAQEARQSDVPPGATPYADKNDSYLCEPAASGAGAFFREISKGIETKREALAEVEATRDDLEALKKEIIAETEKLNAAVAAWDERQVESKKQTKAATAKAITAQKAAQAKRTEEGEVKLAKALAKMPAPSSATVLASLDQNLAARLLKRMPPRQAGATLAALPPVKAAALTTAAIQETP